MAYKPLLPPWFEAVAEQCREDIEWLIFNNPDALPTGYVESLRKKYWEEQGKDSE